MTDVFQVQGDIAAKVADALGVALADSTQRELAAKPTENLGAYDEYLKGEAASQAMGVSDPPSLRRAIAYYQNAVALDSTFALAWARLSHAQIRLYGNSIPDPALAEQARLSAERARRLNPAEPLVYRALGAYHVTMGPRSRARRRRVPGGRPARPRQRQPAGGAGEHRVLSRPVGQRLRPTRPRRAAGPPCREHPGSTGRYRSEPAAVPESGCGRGSGPRARADQCQAGRAEGDGRSWPRVISTARGRSFGRPQGGSSPRPS